MKEEEKGKEIRIGTNPIEKLFLFGLLILILSLLMTAIYRVLLGNTVNLTVAVIIILIAIITAYMIVKLKMILPSKKNKKRLATG